MNLFKWINELFVGKRDWDSFSDEDKKKFSPFMVNRYLSMSDDFLPFVNHFQKCLKRFVSLSLMLFSSEATLFTLKRKEYHQSLSTA